MGNLLIKNGTVVTPFSVFQSDVLVQDGKIAKVEREIKEGASEIIDATGHYVLPGAIDPHVHLEMPFMGEVSADNFETGTAAAVAGGTTCLIDFVIPGRNQSLLDAMQTWHNKARNAVADYSYHMAVTWFDDSVANEIKECIETHGITSFKVFLAYKGAIGVTETELLKTMTTVQKLQGIVNTHCENGELVEYLQEKLAQEGNTAPKYHGHSRPSYIEGYGTHTAITFARATGCPMYVVHVSCKEAVEAIRSAKSLGLQVFGETCPQYLIHDDRVYDEPNFGGAKYVMSPPIRPDGHRNELWNAIKDGTLDVIGTDHCPFNLNGQKTLGKDDFRKIPNGGPGVEDRLAIMYTYGVLKGRITMNEMVNITATNPALLYGLYPQKGAIMPNADADIVIWDPNDSRNLTVKQQHHNVDYNLYEGLEVMGKARYVLVRGKVAYKEGQLFCEKGAGKFLPRKKFNAHRRYSL